jgi:cobalt transporter subunit CbtB
MTIEATQAAPAPLSARVPAALAALLIGLALFFTAGFAWPGALHNATHDTRHALGLPCH